MVDEPIEVGRSTLGPVTITPQPIEDALEYLKEKARVRDEVRGCRRCPLGDRHNGPVPFKAPRSRPVLAVVGEAPGLQEDRKVAPFIGKSGKLLRKALADAGFPVEEVAFLNTVSCLPTDAGRSHNRPRQPTKDETGACRRNLFDQLAVLRATFVLLAGVHALHAFRPDLQLAKHHGRLYVWEAKYLVLPTYHPASVARRNRDARDAFYDDIATIRQLVKGDLPPEAVISGWCSTCGEPAEFFDPNMAGYCPLHWRGRKQSKGVKAVQSAEKRWHASSYEGGILAGKGAGMQPEFFPDVPRVEKKAKGRIR